MIASIVSLFTLIGIVATILVRNKVFRTIVITITVLGIIAVIGNIVATTITIPIWMSMVVVITVYMLLMPTVA